MMDAAMFFDNNIKHNNRKAYRTKLMDNNTCFVLHYASIMRRDIANMHVVVTFCAERSDT